MLTCFTVASADQLVVRPFDLGPRKKGLRNRASRIIKLQIVSLWFLDTTSQSASKRSSWGATDESCSEAYWLIVSRNQRETYCNLMNLTPCFAGPTISILRFHYFNWRCFLNNNFDVKPLTKAVGIFDQRLNNSDRLIGAKISLSASEFVEEYHKTTEVKLTQLPVCMR